MFKYFFKLSTHITLVADGDKIFFIHNREFVCAESHLRPTRDLVILSQQYVQCSLLPRILSRGILLRVSCPLDFCLVGFCIIGVSSDRICCLIKFCLNGILFHEILSNGIPSRRMITHGILSLMSCL